MRLAPPAPGGWTVGTAMSPEQSQVERLHSLISVSRSLTAELDLNDIIHGILGAAIRVIPGADVGILFLYEPGLRKLKVSHAVGLGPTAYEIEIAPGEGMAGKAFLSGKPTVYTNQRGAAEIMRNAGQQNLKLFEEATRGIRYPQSALSAALVYKGDPIGAFVVENLHVAHAFDSFDRDLVDALAQVAASAIVNARLFESERESRIKLEALNEEIRTQRDQLQRRIDLQESLVEVVKEGFPLSTLARRLAGLTQASVVVLDALNRLRASEPEIDAETARDIGWMAPDAFVVILDHASSTRTRQTTNATNGEVLVSPVVGGNEVLGFIAINSERGFDAVDEDAADVGALVAAAEFLKERAIEENEIRRRSDLLEELLQGRVPPQASTISALRPPLGIAAGALRSDKGRAVHVPNVRIFRTFVAITQEVIERTKAPALVTVWNGHVVVIWALSGRSAEVVETDLRNVVAKLERIAPEWRATFGIGTRTERLEELSATCNEVRLGLQVREELGRYSPVFHVDALGAYRFILRSASGDHVADFCQRALGAVIDHDITRGTELLATFRSYLNKGGSVKEAAEALNIHPHTVQYRLQRLQHLSGLQLSHPDERLTLEMALRVVDALRLVDGPSQSERSLGDGP
jgi:hypothetical protein